MRFLSPKVGTGTYRDPYRPAVRDHYPRGRMRCLDAPGGGFAVEVPDPPAALLCDPRYPRDGSGLPVEEYRAKLLAALGAWASSRTVTVEGIVLRADDAAQEKLSRQEAAARLGGETWAVDVNGAVVDLKPKQFDSLVKEYAKACQRIAKAYHRTAHAIRQARTTKELDAVTWG